MKKMSKSRRTRFRRSK